MNNPNNLPSGNQNFKFTRAKRGYSPKEVDSVLETQNELINTLNQQKSALINESSRLNAALNECKEKIQQLARSTRAMSEERQREKLRLADILTLAQQC